MKLRGFYFITDGRLSKKNNIADAKDAVEGGASVVQYREKEKDYTSFLREAMEIKRICDQKNVLFLINDDVAAALLTDAGGVHLGQDDMPVEKARQILGRKKVIGVTAHNLEEALEAEQKGADYIGLSPIYATSTKKDAGPAAGLELVREAKKKAGIPCVAIGGINKGNAGQVVEAGADALCAISATVAAEDVEKAVKFFANKFV